MTKHTLRIGGQEIRYTATAGLLPAGDDPAKPVGDMFYVAYTRDGADVRTRPIAFLFNGGPGAAAAYLQLGAIGPKRVAFGSDGAIPPPPARLVVNEASWLPFTDLVFVDPLGTGYSRFAAGAEKSGDGHYKAWGVRQDLHTIGTFIRLYLSRNARWRSPKFVVGESYGGFRAAALPGMLGQDFGIGINGAIMISPVLEFGMIADDRNRVLPWALRLPSYAATAWRQGMLAGGGQDKPVPASFLREVESFALGDYLHGLATGRLAGSRIYAKLSRYTALPAEILHRLGGRISSRRFAKSLLRGKGMVVSLYDSSIAAPDPHPESFRLGPDPVLGPVTARITEAFGAYVAHALHFETDRDYRTLNHEISRNWKWSSAIEGGQGYAGVAEDLMTSLLHDDRFGALIAHGLYDLVTPYFVSAYLIAQMHLPDGARRRVALKLYPGGHMMYTHDDARQELARDAETFVHDRLTPLLAPGAPTEKMPVPAH